MGAIYQHDVNHYINKYNLENYIETGTGEGTCLSHVLNFPFKKYYSVEIYKQVYKNVLPKFIKNENCNILLGNSYEVLPNILREISGNVLFFLDAHFPGADFHYETYTSVEDYDTRLPLKKEIETIVSNRDTKNDVFIIDDLRVYEDNDYTDGNWPLRSVAGGDGIDFIYNYLSDTHDINKDLRYQGFLIITPKNNG
jgi:hypothetical protein